MLAEWARCSGIYVTVLGQVAFYERAGFSAARAARLTSPYPVAQTLIAGPGDDAPEAGLIYPAAFATH
jgi:putative acetyltransferase